MRLILVFVFILGFVLAKEVPFALEDIERIISLEEGQKAIIQKIEDTNRRIDDVISIMLWGFGVLFAGMMTLIGFVIWDRRSALAPAIRKAKEGLL